MVRESYVWGLVDAREHPEELGVYSGYPKKRMISSDEESIDRETNNHLSLAGVRSSLLGRLFNQ